MYDKVKLWIDKATVGEQFPIIANYLDEANTQLNHQTGEIKTYGSIDGLKVFICSGGLSVVGSLSKFLYNSNVYPLDRHTTAQAIEKLSEALHLQANEANVIALEFGTNFLMMHPVSNYLSMLGSMPRLERYNFEKSSLYYKGMGKQQARVFAFYDKIAEAKAKKMDCPDEWKNENLLRYEMRLNCRLSQQLKVQEIKASTLSERPFYKKMVESYQSNYFSISKFNQIKTNVMSDIKTVTDAYNVFVAKLISQSDQSQISGFLDEIKEAGVFSDRKNYTRLKKKIQEVATKANVTVSDELIKELDDEIKNCGAYI